MTEEQLHDKAMCYAIEVTRARHPENAKYSDHTVLGTAEFNGYDMSDAFEDGARYALNSIWHNTEEEKPKDGQWVLGIYGENEYGDINLYRLKYNHCAEENDEWWSDIDGDEPYAPKYWMAIPASPFGDNFGEEIVI